MSTTTQASPQEITYNWLRYARDNYTSVQNGTGPTSSTGGQAARFTWDVTTPANPFWAWAIALQIKLAVTITIPASGSVTFSPLAPYSAIGVQMTIGGGQAIQPMSLVPFWLDYLTSRREGSFSGEGPSEDLNVPALSPGSAANKTYLPEWEFNGVDSSLPSAGVISDLTMYDGSSYYVPGQTVTNSGTSTQTINLTISFKAWMQLGRKLYARQLEDLTGCVPLGDPSNRPILNLNVSQLLGTNPENNLIVSATSGATCTTSSSTVPTCQLIWVSKELDQLPDNVQVGTPKVLSALEVNTNAGFAIPNAGQFANLQFDTAMVYTKRFHVLVNNQLPISADYFGIWYSENQANARVAWDATLNTMQEYYRSLLRRYGRYLPKGVYVADMVGGEFPEIPRETPYRGEIVTSTTLSALTGLKPYPNAQTTIRIPSGVSISGAYCTTYSFGTVPVSY